MTESQIQLDTDPAARQDSAPSYYSRSFSDYIQILKRRWQLISLTFVVIFISGVFFAYSLPPLYRSTATFLVKQQSIREDIVRTTVTGYTDEQIQEVGQRVSSTSNLKALIEKYNLFPDLNKLAPGEAIQAFKKNTFFEPVTAEVLNPRTGRSMLTTVTFDISFESSSPEVAQQVASELADLYVEENLRSRAEQVQATIDFLTADIERINADLQRTGQGLTDFRAKHASNLPNLENYHLQLAERTERQIDGVDAELREVRDRKIELEGQLRGLLPYAPTYDENGNPIIGSGERLAELRRERLRLLSLYSSEHPDIIRIEREIEALSGSSHVQSNIYDLQAQVDFARTDLVTTRQRYSDDHPDVRQKSRELRNLEDQLIRAGHQQSQVMPENANPQVRLLQELIDAGASDIKALNRRRGELIAKLEDTEGKLARLPIISREFTQLTFDNEQALNRYNEALGKLDEARMAERLEAGGRGQRFVLIGEPQVPAKPYQPIRTAILILVIVLGLGTGVILATVIDTLDSTVKSSRDILVITGAPALAVIPYLENDSERRIRTGKNSAVIGLLAISLIGAVILSQTLG